MIPMLAISIARKSSCHRGSEQGGRRQAEDTAHEHDFFILFIKTELFPDSFPDAAANLHGSALTSDGAAAQNGQDGGNKDQKAHAKRNMSFFMDAVDSSVCAGIIFIVKKTIQKYDGKSGNQVKRAQPRDGHV